MGDGITVLIVGGYGTFGGRLVDLLQDEARLTLIVAGRSLDKAKMFCNARPNSKAKLISALFDREGDIAMALKALTPQILVDASGPFQAYGERPYAVIEACIAHGVHYLDLADGVEFVAGVAAFDAAAKVTGLYVLSGVSSFPVLTAAVIRRLSVGMKRIDSIRGGIAPSPYAGVGGNVIRAIASYAGQPIQLRRNGVTAVGHALTEQMRYTIAVPGRVPLRNLMFSLVDVPDLRALVELWPEVSDIWIGAGPVPAILHRMLVGLSWLVRLRLLPSLLPLAPLIYHVSNRLRWGEHRGGMFVEVRGVDAAGLPRTRSWHLLAEGDDGPYIPSMAVEAIVRKVLAGSTPALGARTALNDVELEEYERLFSKRTIWSGSRSDEKQSSLYRTILGSAWETLPHQIAAMHDNVGIARGRANVERGKGFLARLVAGIIGFPQATDDTEVSVQFAVANGVETWTRTFGSDSFFSKQFAGRCRSGRLLCERFGKLSFAMAVVVDEGRLSLVLRRWSLLGIPLPMALCARTTSYETVIDSRFNFHVEIGHPLTGLIVRYRGWLVPE